MKHKDEELLQKFFDRADDGFEHWAEVRINEIEQLNPKKDISPAEFEELQKLIASETGRQALKKILIECGRSNFFSTLTYIDGYTAVKSLELVDSETLEPLSTGMLSPYFSRYCAELDYLNEWFSTHFKTILKNEYGLK